MSYPIGEIIFWTIFVGIFWTAALAVLCPIIAKYVLRRERKNGNKTRNT